MRSLRLTAPETERTPHEIAAEWVRREETDHLSPAERERLALWIEADPSHRAAWNDIRLALDTVGHNAAHPEFMAMRKAALAARAERRWSLWGLAGVVVAAAILGGAGWRMLHPAIRLSPPPVATAVQTGPTANPNLAVYSTTIGERSAFALPDGSVVTLDTNSLIRLAYTRTERGVRLLRGQAMFDVAKHKAIPFQVYAGDHRITAVGTKFNVRLDGSDSRPSVSVALLEGVVKVATLQAARDYNAPVEVVTMAAGEMLEAKPAMPIRVVATDTDRVTSWRDGVLTFDDAPLGQAIAEMNRYTTQPIALADPRLANFRVSGVFKTADADRFAETMAEVFPITIDHDTHGSIVLEPRG